VSAPPPSPAPPAPDPCRRVALFLANGFGLGNSPIASGTTGALPGLLLAAAIWRFVPGVWAPAAIALVLTAAAIPLCDVAERHYGRKDDGRIVADEWMTFPLCMVGLTAANSGAWILGVAFVANRLCDIVKPFPAHRAQRLRGGLGIVADDAIAALYALILVHAARLLAARMGWAA
jgi:phosphatidylglycerophosphatase A